METIVILFIVGSLITIAAGVGYVMSARAAGAARSWPAVPGTILSSEWVQLESLNPGNAAARVYSYGVSLAYSYSVDGQTYRGRRLRAGQTGTYDRAEAEADLAKYPVGATPRVLYNPQNPEDSMLEVGGASSYTKGMLAVGVGFVAVAILLLFLGKFGILH